MLKDLSKIFSSVYSFEKKKILILFSLFILSMILEYISISIIIPLITALIDPNNLIIGEINSYLIKILPEIITNNLVIFFVSIFFFIICLRLIATVFTEIYIVKYSRLIEIDIIKEIMNFQFIENSLNILKRNKHKLDFSKLILSDIPSYISVGLIPILVMIKNLLLISVIILILLLNLNHKILILVISLSLGMYLLMILLKGRLINMSIAYNKAMQLRYLKVNQFIKGFKIIILNNLKNFFTTDYYDNERKLISFEVTRKLFQILPKSLFEFITIFLILIFVIYNKASFVSNVPILAVLVVIAIRLQPMFVQISQTINLLNSHRKQIEIVDKIIKEICKISYKKFDPVSEDKKSINRKNNLLIENVSFSYSKDKKIFKKINLNFEFDKIYGIVGQNGSGKSTFGDLVSGFLKPTSGKITFNNIDINNKNLIWQDYISYLNQSLFVFNETIKNNITLSKFTKRKVDEKSYKNIINSINLTGFIKSLKKNDNTSLGDLEDKISGGQTQKINLARNLYNNSPIIILDEPTAAIDKISIPKIKKILKELKQKRIIIIISHSKNFLDICDEVFEIKNFSLKKNNLS